MNKGDWVICTTDGFIHYTKYKKYQLLADLNGSVLDIINDYGFREYPSYYGNIPKKVYYFMTIEKWREDRINKVLE